MKLVILTRSKSCCSGPLPERVGDYFGDSYFFLSRRELVILTRAELDWWFCRVRELEAISPATTVVESVLIVQRRYLDRHRNLLLLQSPCGICICLSLDCKTQGKSGNSFLLSSSDSNFCDSNSSDSNSSDSSSSDFNSSDSSSSDSWLYPDVP